MLKVLLTSAIDKNREEEARLPPLGLAYLIGYVKRYYPQRVEFRIADENIEKVIESFRPDLVGISSVTQNYNKAKEIAAFCKKKGIFCLIGGIHISMLPSSLHPSMNLGIIGEGEETFLEIIKEFDKNRDDFRYESIKGIVYRKNGSIMFTEARPLIGDIDTIPFPAREFLKIDTNNIHMFTSRGCPYRCIFCASTRFWYKLRFHSAHYIVEEIKHLIEKYDVKNITFYDDLFIADKERLAKVVELLEQNKIKIGFYLSARANLINEDVLRLLRRMNTKTISMGLESGNDRVLHYLKGNSVSLSDNTKAVRLIQKFGFNMTATFVMGVPDETKNEILDTLDFIKKLKIEDFDIYLLTPLPGTPIWQHALDRKLVSNNMDWSKLDIVDYKTFDNRIIVSEKLSAKELHGLYERFQDIKKRRRITFLLKEGLKKPARIIPFLLTKAKYKIFRKIRHSE